MRHSSTAANRAVFLDRDGVLNKEVNYLFRIEDLVWIPGAKEAVARLNEAGFLVLVVTNQAGIARGYFVEDDMHRLHEHMQHELREVGAHVDAFYHSPFHSEGVVEEFARKSDCRKPGTALFVRAIREWNVDTARSFVVGDKNSDIEPGRELGLKTILVETGHGLRERRQTNADLVVESLREAVAHILKKPEVCDGKG